MNTLGTIKNNGDQDLYVQKLESAVNIQRKLKFSRNLILQVIEWN